MIAAEKAADLHNGLRLKNVYKNFPMYGQVRSQRTIDEKGLVAISK